MYKLKESKEFDSQELEKIDQVFGKAGRAAKNKVKKKPCPWWFLELTHLQRRLRTTNKQIRMFKTGQNWSRHLEQQLQSAGVANLTIPYTLSACYAQRQVIKAELRKVQNNSRKYRKDEQIEQLYRHQLTGDQDRAKALKIIHNAELLAEAFRLMRAARLNHQPPCLTNLDVPMSWTRFNFEAENLDQLENPKGTTNWTTITDPNEIERYLLLRNRLHFRQAQRTPLTVPPLSNLVN